MDSNYFLIIILLNNFLCMKGAPHKPENEISDDVRKPSILKNVSVDEHEIGILIRKGDRGAAQKYLYGGGSAHSNKDGSIKCPLCEDVICRTKECFNAHVKVSHYIGDLEPLSPDGHFHHCPMCGYPFGNFDALEWHFHVTHPEDSPPRKETRVPDEKSNELSERLVKCSLGEGLPINVKESTEDTSIKSAGEGSPSANMKKLAKGTYNNTKKPAELPSTDSDEDASTKPDEETSTTQRADDILSDRVIGEKLMKEQEDILIDQVLAEELMQEEEDRFRREEEDYMSYNAIYGPGGILQEQNDFARKFQDYYATFVPAASSNSSGAKNQQRPQLQREQLPRQQSRRSKSKPQPIEPIDEGMLDAINLSESSETIIDNGKTRFDDIMEHVKYGVSHCKESKYIVATYFVSTEVDFYSYGKEDAGWGCGYRNFQMLLSAMLRTEKYGGIVRQYFRKFDVVVRDVSPSIPMLQKVIEYIWTEGLDDDGKKVMGGKAYKGKNWIGTSQIKNILTSMRIRTEMFDVYNHFPMVKWIMEYFKSNEKDKMPLYLQHAGHSRTIVGVEIWDNKGVNVLVLDPNIYAHHIFRKDQLEFSMEQIRIDANGFSENNKKLYQLLKVDGIMESDKEYEDSKLGISEEGL